MVDRYADVKGSSGSIDISSKTPVVTTREPTTTVGSSNTNSFQNVTTTDNTTTNTQNIDPKDLAALQTLVQQLLSGGTPEQKAAAANRSSVQQIVQGLLGNYTKQSAQKDAEGLVAQQLRQALEANMPALTKSIEGAGTSASSMQGLLAQKLAVESAQASSAAGLDASVKYGQISANLAAILDSISKPNDSVVQDLVNALAVAKNATQTSTTNRTINQNTVSGSTTTQEQTQFGGDTTTKGGETTNMNIPFEGGGSDLPYNTGNKKVTAGNNSNPFLDIQVNDPYAAGKALDQAIQDDNFDWSNATNEQLQALQDYYNS